MGTVARRRETAGFGDPSPSAFQKCPLVCPTRDNYSVGHLELLSEKARVPLGTRARVHMDAGRTQINREKNGRFLALKCNFQGRDMGTFFAEAQAKVAKQVRLPEGYYMTWGGEFENQRRAMKRLMIIVPISVLLIFALLFMSFRAALPALVVLLDVPFATVGGVFALYLTHTVLSVSAVVGFITLFGVAVMDGVLLITYVRAAMDQHGAETAPWRIRTDRRPRRRSVCGHRCASL